MTGAKHYWMLWAALIVSIAAYQLWEYLPKWEFNGVERKPYYIGIALFIFTLCAYILVSCGRHLITIFLFVLSGYNFLDELFFNPGEYVWYEWASVVTISVLWYAMKKIKQFDELSK